MEKYYHFSLVAAFALGAISIISELLDKNYAGFAVLLFIVAILLVGLRDFSDGVPYWKKWSFYISQWIFLGVIIVFLLLIKHLNF